MKYIRTKDHLEELYIDEFTEYGKEYYKNCKIADTIEELCDVFIRIKDRNNYRFFLTSSMEQVEGWKNYGAIWTEGEHGEPILKAVARMNVKGELELL